LPFGNGVIGLRRAALAVRVICCAQIAVENRPYSIVACDLRHYLEPVVHRVTQILLAAQIALRGLDRDMAEPELNLFQFAAALRAQLGAGSAKVMRGHVLWPYAVAISMHHVPDNVHVDGAANSE
jgi:hypothetical protein